MQNVRTQWWYDLHFLPLLSSFAFAESGGLSPYPFVQWNCAARVHTQQRLSLLGRSPTFFQRELANTMNRRRIIERDSTIRLMISHYISSKLLPIVSRLTQRSSPSVAFVAIEADNHQLAPSLQNPSS